MYVCYLNEITIKMKVHYKHMKTYDLIKKEGTFVKESLVVL